MMVLLRLGRIRRGCWGRFFDTFRILVYRVLIVMDIVLHVTTDSMLDMYSNFWIFPVKPRNARTPCAS